ncbi:MAG TPA: hypothetical protein VJT82_01435 [Pyrinomonadaceae bacterium]|nr:hypothetical protein [Pyrinomonadaceae bacterium]
MRKPPVVEVSAEKQELRRRLALSNRPRLNVGLKQLDQVSSVLANSGGDRKRFIKDPTAYLQSQSVPVSSCDFVQTTDRRAAQTSEVCAVFVVCTSYVNVQQDVSIYCVMDCNFMIFSRVYTSVIGFELQDAGIASNFDYLQPGGQVL